MSEDRAEAMNPGPNNPVSEAEALREEIVAERINPGGDGISEEFPAEVAERITPGPDGGEAPVPEALNEAEHRMSPGPQE